MFEREVLLIGGDIHCGVTSEIFDNETDLTIRNENKISF